MMNEARVGVGLGATCLGYSGYLHSLDYAKGRPQGRPVSAKDPASPQVPIIQHADVKRMLLAQKAYVERSEEHTSELQSLMRNSYAVFCLKKKNKQQQPK